MKILVKENLIKKSMFHRTTEELREFTKENNIKLLRLLEYLRRRNNKKIQARCPELKGN
jgi:hypothetical protein